MDPGSIKTFGKRLAPVFVILGLIGASWFCRAAILGLALRQAVIPVFQSQAPGLVVRFKDVDTNLVSRLEVNQLTFDYCRKDTCLKAAIPSIRVSYALAGVFSGRGLSSLIPQLKVEIDSPLVTGSLTATESPAKGKFRLPRLPMLPALRVNNGSLDLTIPGRGTVSAKGMTFSSPLYLALGRKPLLLRLTAEQMNIKGPGVPRQEGAVSLSLRYRPERVEVPELTFAGKPLLKDAFMEMDSQGLHFATELYLLQSKGQVQGSIEQGEARGVFHLAEGDIEELAGAAGVTPSVSGQLKADGKITMTLGHPETMAGSVTASIRNGSLDGAVIDRFELKARAGEEKVSVDTMELSINGSQISLSDGETPIHESGVKSWLEQLKASRAKVQARLTNVDTLPPSWSGPILKHWQALGLEGASADMTLDGARILVTKAAVSGRAGRLKIDDAVLDLSAGTKDWLTVPWSAHWQAELSDSAIIHYFWEDWPATGGAVTGQGEFSGTLSEPSLPCQVTITGGSLYGVRLAKVAGHLKWTKDRLALDVIASNREHDRMDFRGTIDLDKGGLLATTVAAAVDDLSAYLPIAQVRNQQISGPFTGNAKLAGEFSRLQGTIKAKGDWVINGVRVSGADTEVALTGDEWSVRSFSGRINDALAVATAGTVRPAPGFKAVTVGLDRLHLSYQGEDLSLQRASNLTLSKDAIAVADTVVLAGAVGTFRLRGALGGKGQLSLVGEGVSDTGLVSKVMGRDVGFERMDFTLGLSGSLSRPDWRWQGTIRELAASGAPLELSGRFDLASTSQGLWIKQCELGDNGQSMALSGRLPLALGPEGASLLPYPFDLKGHITMPEAGVLPKFLPEWLAESGSVQTDFTLAGTWDHPQGRIQFDASGLKPGTRWRQAPPGPFAVHGLALVEKDHLSISTFDLTSPGFSMQAAGSISRLPLAQLVARHQADSAEGEISLTGHYSIASLAWLAAKMPGVRRTGGSVDGSFAVTGKLFDPQVRMDLAVKNGEARGTDSLLVARGITMQASLAHDQLTISTLSGTLGGAEVQGEGTIKGVTTPNPALDVHMTGKDLLLYRADGVKIRSNSTLVLGGTLLVPQLSGEVLLTDSRITKRVNWLGLFKPGTHTSGNQPITLFSFADPPLKDLHFNLRIKGAQPLVIKNNVFKGELRPDLTLAGTGEVPYLTGVIYADNGRFTLPTGRLDVEQGLIRFSDDSPDRPTLDVQATGRMMGYDITAQVKGVYDEPEVTLSSSPPLANEDLLMLVLTGRQPVVGRAASSGMSSVAVYFGRGLLSRVFGGEDNEFELLERLEVDVGRAVSLQGEPTVDAKFKLANVDWGRESTVYLTGEKDVWDYYNGGLRVVFRFH